MYHLSKYIMQISTKLGHRKYWDDKIDFHCKKNDLAPKDKKQISYFILQANTHSLKC